MKRNIQFLIFLFNYSHLEFQQWPTNMSCKIFFLLYNYMKVIKWRLHNYMNLKKAKTKLRDVILRVIKSSAVRCNYVLCQNGSCLHEIWQKQVLIILRKWPVSFLLKIKRLNILKQGVYRTQLYPRDGTRRNSIAASSGSTWFS